jgi:hypothetical protein
VQFTIPASTNALLTLHDLLGREVLRILDAGLQSGPHTASLNASGLAAGTYVLRLNAGGLHAQRLLLITR